MVVRVAVTGPAIGTSSSTGVAVAGVAGITTSAAQIGARPSTKVATTTRATATSPNKPLKALVGSDLLSPNGTPSTSGRTLRTALSTLDARQENTAAHGAAALITVPAGFSRSPRNMAKVRVAVPRAAHRHRLCRVARPPTLTGTRNKPPLEGPNMGTNSQDSPPILVGRPRSRQLAAVAGLPATA